MVVYKCPNCGRQYSENERFCRCSSCGCGLKKAEDVKTVAHPELNPMLSDSHVIGYVNSSSNNQPKCPTCGSTNISKIGTLNRMFSVGLFGLASSKIGKTHKCNNCGSTW